jgi:hypothetical protein
MPLRAAIAQHDEALVGTNSDVDIWAERVLSAATLTELLAD